MNTEFALGCTLLVCWFLLSGTLMICKVTALANDKNWEGASWVLKLLYLALLVAGVALVAGNF